MCVCVSLSELHVPKRHSLSLRRGRKRLSSGECGLSPSSKKARLSPPPGASETQDKDSAITVQPPPAETQVSLPLPEAESNVADIVVGIVPVAGGNGRRPPDLFAPEGADPAAYTNTILRVLNSYIQQLQLAQKRVMFRELWSQPVVTYHRQPRGTLAHRYSQSRHHSRAAVGVAGPTIDLGTGEVTQWSPETGRRGPTDRSCRKKRNTLFDKDEDSDFVSCPTPKRPQLSETHTSLSDTHHSPHSGPSGDPHSGPLQADPHSGPPEPGLLKSGALKQNGVCPYNKTSEQPSPVTSTPPTPVTITPVTSTPPTPVTITPPTPVTITPVTSTPPTPVTITPLLSSTAGDGERGVEGAGGNVLSGEEMIEDGSRKRRRRRRTAHISDDSETEDNDSHKDSADDAVLPSISKTGHEKDTNRLKPHSLAPIGRGRRVKRFTFTKLPVKSMKSVSSNRAQLDAPNAATSVIDLTADPIAAASPSSSLSPTPSPTTSQRVLRKRTLDSGQQVLEREGEEEEKTVVCPLCGESFDQSVVETHAESCEGPQVVSPVQPKPTARRVRQTTLLTPRFRRYASHMT